MKTNDMKETETMTTTNNSETPAPKALADACCSPWINYENEFPPKDESWFLAICGENDLWLLRWYPNYNLYAEDGYVDNKINPTLSGLEDARSVRPVLWQKITMP